MTQDYHIPTPKLKAMLVDIEGASEWISRSADSISLQCRPELASTACPKLAAVVRIALKSLESARSYLMGRANRENDYDTDMDVHDDICKSIQEMEQVAKEGS